jgi:glycosyltransferase involved in cell wall biosynthesis
LGGSTAALLIGISGIVPDDESPEALAAILGWCTKHPDRLRDMGNAGRAWASEEFSPERYRARVLGLLRSGEFCPPLDLRIERRSVTRTESVDR